MAKKLSIEALNKIVARRKPGFRVITQPNAPQPQATSVMADQGKIATSAPDIQQMLAKLRRNASGGGYRATVSADAGRPATSNSSQIISVAPANADASGPIGTTGQKVIVVSAEDQDIVAEQG